MNDLYEKVEERILELKKIVREKEKSLEKAPKGIVNVHSADGRIQYYYKESSDDTARRYLKNSEKQLVKELCQKDYDQKVLSVAQKELKELEKLKKLYMKQTCEDVYDNLNMHRKSFVNPIWLPDKEFIEKWEDVTYDRMEFRDDAPEYYTDKGERVRSKSEILIANALKRQNISYRYECPLYLNGYGTVYPDFTVLNVKTREEIYWEHLGMMDDAQYVEGVLKKIETYEKNGIFPGERLLLTFESRRNPISQKVVNLLIERHLK